jgi:uncharacterized protein
VRRALGLAFALVLVSATPAFAHVSVNPSTASEGSYAKLTFRVPNESDTASTTSVEVAMPDGVELQSVSVKPTPGWDSEIERDGDAVTSVTWSGGKIGPGEFQEFEISVGPIPSVDSLVFPAVQTYDDGEVVRWIDPMAAGEEEPEHPAPTVTVGEGTGDHHDGGEAAVAEDPDDDGVDGTEPIAFAALLLAGVATVAAIAALIFARKRPPV